MTLLLQNGQVFDGDTFQRADILIEDSRIAAVGPDLADVRQGTPTWNLDDDLVIPGLVNAHYHSPDNLSTGLVPSAPLELWSLASVPSRGNDPEVMKSAALLGAAQLLRGGVTGVVDMVRPWPRLTYEAFDAVAAAYAEAGVRAAIVPVLRDLPTESTLPLPEPSGAVVGGSGESVEDQLAIVEALHRAWHGRHGRIAIHVGPSGPQRCSDTLLAAAGELAQRLGTILHTHAVETRAQAEQAHRRWGQSMLRRMDTLGLLTPHTVLAHVVWPEPGEANLLADRGSVVVHNPASNCTLGSGRAPLPSWLASGVRVALGTDAATCNDSLSMFEAMKLATILHRPTEPDWQRWPEPLDALTLATRGGAAALGMGVGAGTIAVGRPADLAILDHRAPAFVPSHDPVRQLVLRATESVVRHVLVAGEVRVRDGELIGLDWAALADSAARLAARRSSADKHPSGRLVEPITRMLRRVRGGGAGW